MAVTRLALMVGSRNRGTFIWSTLTTSVPAQASRLFELGRHRQVYLRVLGFRTRRHVHTWSQQMTIAMMLMLLLLLLMLASLFTLSLCAAGRASAVRHSAFFCFSSTHTHRLWATRRW